MSASVSPNSDVESVAPTIVDDAKPRGDQGAVDQVVAPGEETPQAIQQEKGDPFLVQWDGPDDPGNPKVSTLSDFCAQLTQINSRIGAERLDGT